MTVHVIDESELPVIEAALDLLDQKKEWSMIERDLYYAVLKPAYKNLTGREWDAPNYREDGI